MTVTDFKHGRRGLSTVYIDGEAAVCVDKQVLVLSGITVGSVISDEALKKLLEDSELHRAKEKALNLIAYRSHSRKELIDKLRRTYSEHVAVAVADRLEKTGLINDEDFARRYAQSLADKNNSAREIVMKLCQKGIDRDFAAEIAEEMQLDPCLQIAALLNRKYPKYTHDEKVRKRAYSALLRHGFSYSDINAVLAQICEDGDCYP